MKLFRALRAMDDAGLEPGITSAFRDDYRQSIASGLKAASNRSYHGGSLRGGYGHGLAADIVSVKGATRGQRWISTEILWKWVDAHGEEYGVGRPYLDRDPPHVGPIDGKEYVDKRLGGKARQAKSETPSPRPKPETNLDGLTILAACRLHLRLGRSWCTLTDEMCHETCRARSAKRRRAPAVARKRGSRLNCDSRRRNRVTTARSFLRD